MVSRTKDLLLCFDGGIPFFTSSTMKDDVSLVAYKQAQAGRNDVRDLLTISQGADENIDGNVQSVLDRIKLFTRDDLRRIGVTCILGRSNGCSLALGVAAKLQSLEVPLTFVGVSDVTMYPSGRNPPIAGIGNLRPRTDPITTGAKGATLMQIIFGSLLPVPIGAIPKITLDTVIKASEGTVNHYQIKGNHMKYALSVEKWIWFSDMADGEVHGEIDSFQNKRFDDVIGNSDLDLHIDVNTQQHWKELAAKASVALAKIP